MPDEHLLALLAATDGIAPTVVRRVTSAWTAQRHADEPLAGYLIRNEVLRPTATDTLRWAERGLVTLMDARPLFRPGGLAKLASCAPLEPATVQPPVARGSLSETQRPARIATEPTVGGGPLLAEPGPQVGSVLGKFLLIEQLGKGGAGVVFRALHQGLNIPVAIKVLHGVVLQNPEAYRRLREEARMLARLDHPNIVRVLDFEDDPRCPFVVMECVEGMSLSDLIRQCGCVSPARAAGIAARVAEALSVAWKLGVVHRDIKPANVLIAKDGTPKLADLGLAIVVDPAGNRNSSGTAPTAEAVGTAAYMAPEQFVASDSVDFRADMYSLGVTLYQAVTGRLPFEATSLPAMILKHMRETPVPPERIVPAVPAALSALILRLMAKEPAARFGGYDALVAALREVADETPRTVSAPTKPSGKLSSVVGRFLRRSVG